jgi:hypothetical protein
MLTGRSGVASVAEMIQSANANQVSRVVLAD